MTQQLAKEYPNKPAEKGFSLIELSISMTIIGLLIAGTLLGKNLITQSETQRIITQIQDYRAAFQLFEKNFRGKPGDIYNASSFFTGATNGNGDGQLATAEIWPMWKHLADAKMIAGTYSGTATANEAVPGTNVPDVKFSRVFGGFYVLYTTNFTGFNNHYKNMLALGAQHAAAVSDSVFLTPTQASLLDQKMDDGIPLTGGWGALGGWTGAAYSVSCTSGAGAASTYQLTVTTKECYLIAEID